MSFAGNNMRVGGKLGFFGIAPKTWHGMGWHGILCIYYIYPKSDRQIGIEGVQKRASEALLPRKWFSLLCSI